MESLTAKPEEEKEPVWIINEDITVQKKTADKLILYVNVGNHTLLQVTRNHLIHKTIFTDPENRACTKCSQTDYPNNTFFSKLSSPAKVC